MSKIRILAMDGGGSRAGVLARTLGKLYGETTRGREILREFDYVAGNSGGAIVMAALCSNFTPGDVAGFYDDPATLRQMFSPRWVDRVPLLRCVLPRYSSVGKARALAAMLDRGQQGGEPPPSTILMREWPAFLTRDIRLLITAFDYDRERVAFFRSHTASRAQSSAPATDVTLAAALHASTNAPILFYDRPAEVGGRRYWDGAFAGYNNPVLAAVIEALANAPERADDLRVLSIGTGTVWQPCVADDVPLAVRPRARRSWSDCSDPQGRHGDHRRSAGRGDVSRTRSAAPADACNSRGFHRRQCRAPVRTASGRSGIQPEAGNGPQASTSAISTLTRKWRWMPWTGPRWT